MDVFLGHIVETHYTVSLNTHYIIAMTACGYVQCLCH